MNGQCLLRFEQNSPLPAKTVLSLGRAGVFCGRYERCKVPSTLAPHANQQQYWWYRFSVLLRPCPALYIHSTGPSHRKPKEGVFYSLDEVGVLSRR
jgi:hypothetical protein